MSPARILAVIRFEFRRTATLPRLAWWLVLAILPVTIEALLVGVGEPIKERDVWSGILFTQIPIIVCMLGLLLWATPIVYTEVEGNSWPYLAVRPDGKASVLIGKYVAAVVWTALAGWAGLSLALVIARPERALQMWSVMAVLVLLSTIAYGALFTFIGVVVHRRPMVAAVAYALLFEFVVSFVPAVVNQFTIQFRLRTLFFVWTDWNTPPPADALRVLAGTGSPATHVLILIGLAVLLLVGSVWLLRRKTLISSSDA